MGKRSAEDIEVEALLEELDRKHSKNLIRTPQKNSVTPGSKETRKRLIKEKEKNYKEVSAESTTEERRSDAEVSVKSAEKSP
jgi:hypothetical protein